MERLTKRYGHGMIGIGEPLRYYNYDDIKHILEHLATIEDILGDEYDLDRLRELVKADQEGRCKIIPEFNGKKCGSCKHFKRISGTMRGTCKVRPLVVSRWGGKQLKFEPNQSHLACSKYESALKGE